jgi:O-antigen/teichoic acid export membrane protein
MFYFILLVRKLETHQYGAYVALIASIDIFYLSTGLGLSTIAQRYVAEYRIKASNLRLRRFFSELFLKRFLLSAATLAILMALYFWFGSSANASIGIDAASMPWAALVLLLSASVLFLDEVLGSLLYQGIAQGLLMFRTLTKIGGLFVLMHLGMVDLHGILIVECVVSLLSLVAGHLLLTVRLRDSLCEPEASDSYVNPSMYRVARRFYLIQLIGQTYGPSVSKLMVTRVLGLAQTAALGFAQSMADMLRNYLPAYLLAGWIRPLMVSRYIARRNPADLADIAGLIIKLNLLGIVPAVAFLSLRGNAFGSWVSGGKYTEAGLLLVFLMIMVGMQTVHLMFSMIAVTLEEPTANLIATVCASLGLPLSLLLARTLGIEGAAAGLVLSELIWLITAGILLRRRGFEFPWDVSGGSRIAVAGCVAAAAVHVLGLEQPTTLHMVGGMCVAVSVFLVVSILLKPLRQSERMLINGVVPIRYVLL